MIYRRVKGRAGFYQECEGYFLVRRGGKGKRARIFKTLYFADKTREATATGLRKLVLSTPGFKPKRYFGISPIHERIRVPIWSKAFWIGKAGLPK